MCEEDLKDIVEETQKFLDNLRNVNQVKLSEIENVYKVIEQLKLDFAQELNIV